MKKILTFLSAIFVSSSALADELPTVTLGGFVDTQAGYVSEKRAFKPMDPTNPNLGKRSNFGIVNDTKIEIKAEGKSHHGFKYGGYIKINADTSRDEDDNDDNVANKTMIYIESPTLGRAEGGAYDSVSRKMLISANSLGVSNGGINGYQQQWFNGKNIDGTSYGSKFVKWPELLTNCNCISFANKVSYYTPKVSGVQVGVSYTPDVAVHGTVTKLASTPKNEDKNFKNLVDYGITYETKARDVNFQIGLVGQFGKSKVLTVARTNVRAWELGSSIGYKGFTVAGSFSDWGKSATPVIKDPNKKYGASYWTLGAAYEHKCLTTSVSYFKGKRANVFATATDPIAGSTALHDRGFNKNQYLIFGAAYKLAPGFLPYAEVTHFKAKRYGATVNNSGYVLLSGTKLAF